MLGNDPFYFGIIRRYHVLVGNVFTDVRVPRFSSDGTTRELVRVPIAIASRDKTIARVLAEPNTDSRPQAVTLPRMSFEMGSPRYDADRHQSSAESIRIYDSTDKTYSKLYAPVPWDFPFSVYVYVKTYEDGLKIVEQVLPFFTPDYTVRAELIDGVVTMNVPIVLDGQISVQDSTTQGAISDSRVIVWTLPLTVKGWLFGPEHESGIIKFIDVPMRTPDFGVDISDAYANNSSALEEVVVRAGLLANGSPTTNAAASVPYDQIEVDDDWDYITYVVSDDAKEGTGGANEPVS